MNVKFHEINFLLFEKPLAMLRDFHESLKKLSIPSSTASSLWRNDEQKPELYNAHHHLLSFSPLKNEKFPTDLVTSKKQKKKKTKEKDRHFLATWTLPRSSFLFLSARLFFLSFHHVILNSLLFLFYIFPVSSFPCDVYSICPSPSVWHHSFPAGLL